MRPYDYMTVLRAMNNMVGDFKILAGEEMGPSDATWQDVAGTLEVNLRVLANQIESARTGNVNDGPVVFPSITAMAEED